MTSKYLFIAETKTVPTGYRFISTAAARCCENCKSKSTNTKQNTSWSNFVSVYLDNRIGVRSIQNNSTMPILFAFGGLCASGKVQ